MKLLADNHLAVLFDSLTWRDNPFVPRDARRDAKRKQPWKALLWMCGTLLVLGGLGVWAIYAITQSVHGFPWFLGGDMGTALCILISGLHVWFIMGAAQKHTSTMLTQEVAHNTFPYLLMLPLPTFQWLLQSAVYPWLAAMRVALLLLPLYGLCVGLGGISWADVLMLYVVFAMIAVSVPAWRKPALSDAVASGVAQTTPAPQSATTPGAMQTTQQQQQAATGTASSGSGGWTVFLFLPMLLGLILAASGRRANSLYFAVKEYIPDDLLILLPSSILSWPLIIARSLVTGFDWFGLPVWPLPFVVIAFLIGRYTQVARSCEFLQVGAYRELPNVETYHPRRRLEYALRVGQGFVLTGYLWKWVVWNGGIGRIIPPLPYSAAPGLNAFIYLILFLTIARLLFRAGNLGRWLIPPRKVTKETTLVRIAPRSALIYLGEPLLFAALFVLACCLFARTNPFAPPVMALAGQMLLVGLSGAALGFVANRAFGILAWLGATIYFLVSMGPAWSHPLMYFSPTLGLLRLGGGALNRMGGVSNLPLDWWRWPLWMGALALTILPLALFLMARAARREEGRGKREEGKTDPTFDTKHPKPEPSELAEQNSSLFPLPSSLVYLDPTQVGLEAFSDAAFAQKTPDAQSDSPVAQRLIASVQSVFDNAVTVKEMRAGLRNRLTPTMLRTTFLMYFVITVVLTLGIPSLTEVFGGGIAESLYGRTSAPVIQALASTLGCWILAFGLTAFGTGTNGLMAFPGEREKSTLGFLMMTPLTGLQIVFGKLAGILFAHGTGALTMGAWMLLLSGALSVGRGSLIPLFVWCWVVCLGVVTAFTIGMLSLAFSALFPRVAHATVRVWIWIIVFQIFIQARHVLEWLWGLMAPAELFAGLFGPLLVFSVVLCNGLLFCLALWGVSRMRKGDIAFATSKREN